MQAGVIFREQNKKTIPQNEKLKEKIRELENEVIAVRNQALETDPKEVGRYESEKEAEQIKLSDTRKIESLIHSSEKNLIEVRSIIPSILYLDKIVVDMNKVTITNKRFLEPESPRSIALTEITSVTCFNAYIFASIEIVYSQQTKAVLKYLSPKKAVEAKKIIDGLLVSKKLDLNFTALTGIATDTLKNKFKKIGE